jgi:hypothetical protein
VLANFRKPDQEEFLHSREKQQQFSTLTFSNKILVSKKTKDTEQEMSPNNLFNNQFLFWGSLLKNAVRVLGGY